MHASLINSVVLNFINMRLYRTFITLTSRSFNYTISDSEQEPQIQVGESSKPWVVGESKNETVRQVFPVFKSYLEDRIDQKGKEFVLRKLYSLSKREITSTDLNNTG